MKKTLIVLSAAFMIGACSHGAKTENKANGEGSSSGESISQEMIENPATASEPDKKPDAMAEMTFKTTEHDFGDILENQNVETTYEFTNTGTNDLMISNCQAACGCTVPDWPREPIAPGKTGKIKVAFNSAGRSGVNNKIVTVYANIPQNQIELKFRANVRALPH